ncbi:hypothetical protein OOU_Y34scaffold00315g1 [Pyricularia oryzae Y34]|uniref:Uncharacterized protein n=1 Tax=Pyricularia oryzae (strain Y34) TaxID=1143189 RepID=A0AA97PNC1_PYRO3|nr:hypothetical protein OOU_Y34scaffold00315g1 [Pyricularia oryzae Y34]
MPQACTYCQRRPRAVPGDPFSPGQLLREPDSWIPPEPVSSDYKTRNALLHSSDDKMCALPKPSSGAFLTTACMARTGTRAAASTQGAVCPGMMLAWQLTHHVIAAGARASNTCCTRRSTCTPGKPGRYDSLVPRRQREKWRAPFRSRCTTGVHRRGRVEESLGGGGGGRRCGSSGTGKENLVAQRHEEDAGCSVRNVDPQAGRQEFITNEWYERKKHAFFAPLSRPRAGPTCRMLGVPADGENGGGFAMC